MIRYAKPSDIDFIYDLAANNLETTFDKESLKIYIKEKETFHVFVSEDKDLIGYIILWNSDVYSEIIDIVVKEDKRGKGYGKELLKFTFNFLKKNNIISLRLEVSEKNINAIKLYEKLGFIKERIIKNYYKDSDAVVYIKHF